MDMEGKGEIGDEKMKANEAEEEKKGGEEVDGWRSCFLDVSVRESLLVQQV